MLPGNEDGKVETACAIAEAVRLGRLRALDVIERSLDRIRAHDPRVRAFVMVDPAGARAVATAVDKLVSSGFDPGPLAGVPFAVKDLEDLAGARTGCGSLFRADRAPATSDSVHVARLRAAGAVPIGKTTMPEFAFGPHTSNRVTGNTRNPWDLERTPGGSSGGSAAAVAAGMVPLATGTDRGGSIRIPAAYTGTVGLKPTHGLVAHDRVTVSGISCPGVLATTVTDVARHLDVARGPHPLDPYSGLPSAVSCEVAINELPTKGLVVAWNQEGPGVVVDDETASIAYAAADELIRTANLTLVDRHLDIGDPVGVWSAITAADAWLEIEPGDWPARAGLMSETFRSVLERSDGWTIRDVADAVRLRGDLVRRAHAYFSEVQLLLSPATALPASSAAGVVSGTFRGLPVRKGLAPFSALANLRGAPAISVPAGRTADGVPVGLQIEGRRFDDPLILRLAWILEQQRPWPATAFAAS